jgi:hypothetical protein
MTKYISYQLITCVLCWLHYQFSTTFTNPKLFSVTFVQSVVLHPVFPRYNIISSYLFMCFPSSLFPQVFQSKTLYAFFLYSIHVLLHWSHHSWLWYYILWSSLFCKFLCCCFHLCSSLPQHLFIHWHTVSSFHTSALGLFLVWSFWHRWIEKIVWL